MFELIVAIPFEGHAKGERIVEPGAVAAVLAGPSRRCVVKVAAREAADQKRLAAPAA
ncbi:MAG: hypothetical protein ACREEW_12790 [Caulobacteraceae bacterium]